MTAIFSHESVPVSRMSKITEIVPHAEYIALFKKIRRLDQDIFLTMGR